MRCSWCLLLVLPLGLGTVVSFAEEGPASVKAEPEHVAKLIEQLGSAKFAERARARLALNKIGAPALAALRKAEKSEDAEVRRVATDLVKDIEARLQNARLLAPKRLRLQVKDMPVPDAVAELARLSGYPIQIQGDQAALAARKITLDTGDTTFWEAFDQLCRKAGLVQKSVPGQYMPAAGYVRPPRLRKVQPQQPPVPLPPAPPAVPGKVQAAPPAGQVVVAQVVVPGGAPLPPGGRGRVTYLGPDQPGPLNRGPIVVEAGTPSKVPTCYAGAVRIRAVPPPPGVIPPAAQTLVYLEVTPEPRLQHFSVAGQPHLKKVVDDQGQVLSAAEDQPSAGNRARVGTTIRRAYTPYDLAHQQTVVLRLKTGEKRARALKEISGTINAQALSPAETLIAVDNVLKSAGKKIEGKNGGSLELASIKKEENGDYRLQVRLESPGGQNPFNGLALVPAVPAGGPIQIQVQVIGNVQVVNTLTSPGVPALLDGKGKAYQLVQIPSRSVRGMNGAFTQVLTLVFRANAGQGEPASLVLTGRHPVSLSVAFHFENVPLP
jgi:hypothetical protein